MIINPFSYAYDFSHITVATAFPLLSAIVVFALAVIVLLQNWRSNMNVLFATFSVCIAFWLLGTFMLFLSRDNDLLAIFWDRFIYLPVMLLPILLYKFGAAFAEIQPPKFIVWLGYGLTVFFLAVSQTDYFVSGIFRYQWGVHTNAQIFHHFFLIFFFYYNIRGIVFMYERYRTVSDIAEKQRAKYAFIAFVILYTLGPLGFLPAYGIPVYPIAYVGGVPFVLILTYTITKYRLFNLKAVTAEIFVFALSLYFLLQVFSAKDPQARGLNVALFVVVLAFGFALIQSVLTETEQRERLEELTANLEDLNENLQEKVAEQTKEIRKSYEVERQARLELEELDKAKDQFILTTQHHLRTPLTIVKGFLQTTLTKKAKKLDAESASYLTRASEALDRMSKLINDFLGVSQLEVGKAIFNFQPNNVKAILDEIEQELAPEIERKNLSFVIQFTPEATNARSSLDHEAMKAALYNLIDNAVKYTQHGGVKVSGDIVTHPIDQRKMVNITVQDTGIGIIAEELPKLFTSYFQRGEEAEKLYTTGRGIGLVLSKNIIKAHKGEIMVQSDGRDRGSTFIVQLPLSE